MLAAFFLQFVDGVPTFAPDGGVIEERIQTSLILTTQIKHFLLYDHFA